MTKSLMSWVSSQRRWTKWYKGATYSVSCKQLGTPPSKEASVKAANEWWEAKRTLLDDSAVPSGDVLEYRREIETHRGMADWFESQGNTALAADHRQRAVELEAILQRGGDLPQIDHVDRAMFGPNGSDAGRAVWAERLRRPKAAKPEISVGWHIDDWLRERRAAPGRAAGTTATLTYRINFFRKWIGAGTRLSEITEIKLRDFYLYLVSRVEAGSMSAEHATGCLSVTKRFIRNRVSLRYLDPFRNVNDRDLAIPVGAKAVPVYDLEQIKVIYHGASERMKLYILLMLNTGMSQRDIGALKQDEVDWKKGRITRKRSKTRNQSNNVPAVSYKLWPVTFDLLTKYRSTDPTLVLVNEDGGPLWSERIQDGKHIKSDNIKCRWFDFMKAMGIKARLKDFRKTSASMLEKHDIYGRYAQYFLGHAPRSVADRHYVQPSEERFDEAVAWLLTQYSKVFKKKTRQSK